MSFYKAKILVLGPVKSGKTVISDYLAESKECNVLQYRPTKGVRILQLENKMTLNNRNIDADIELWDCSGDLQYQKCWRAMRRNAKGVILVCRPEMNDGRSLLSWHTEFVERAHIDPAHVLVLLHYSVELTSNEVIADFKLPKAMEKLPIVLANTQKEGESLKAEFNCFLTKIITSQLRIT